MARPKLAVVGSKKLPLASVLEKGLSRYAFYPALGKQRLIRPGEPEELVRMELYNEILQRYGYPADMVDIEFPVLIREDEQPRFADIVVFTDKEHKRPYIVIEAKKPKREDGLKQGQRYATILRAVYVLWSNGAQRASSVIVNRYPEDAASIADIPPFGGDAQYTIRDLRPFRDDRHIAETFRTCHGLIRNLSHLKPDDAFTEFLKILLVKIQDESRGGDFEFQVLLKGATHTPEPVNETAQRIRQIFKLAVEEDSEISEVFQQGDDIALTNDCITQIVDELQDFSFATTPVDQKGRAFETFISGDMRQEFKEFMTPRVVVEAMIEMAQPDSSTTILDPCCGSGAFLIFALKYVRQLIESRPRYSDRQKTKAAFDFAHDRLWGMDASPQMAAVARINMLVNDDGRAHVFQHDSLAPKAKGPEQIRSRHFKLILTNPPFGKRIKAGSSILEHFDLAKDVNGRLRRTGSLLTEILFLERNLEWLAPGGRLFIVLPDSALGNAQIREARRYIEQQARLLAIVSLSPNTFGPSGAKSKTSFIVLEKRAQPLVEDEYDEYSVFVADAPEVGFDFTGRTTGKSDLPTIVADFAAYRDTGRVLSPLSRVINRSELGSTWLAQTFIKREREGQKAEDFVLLGSQCEALSTGKTAARAEYVEAGLHMVKVGNLTGRGIEWEAVERQFVRKEFAERHKRAVLKSGDILFTAAAHGPKWIGLKVDIFEAAPAHIDQPIVFCGEIMMLRLKKDSPIDPYYLLLFLRSDAGYAEIQRCIRGQSGHVYPEEVSQIKVPHPSTINSAKLSSAIADLKQAHIARGEAVRLEKAALGAANTLFAKAGRKPIIAL